MATLRRMLSSATLLAAMAGLASANSITQYAYVDSIFAGVNTYTPGTTLSSATCSAGAASGCTSLNYPNGGGDLSFAVQQFNSSLGVLNSVTIDLIGTVSASVTITNMDIQSQATLSSYQGNLDFFTWAPTLTQPTDQSFPTGVPAFDPDVMMVSQVDAGTFLASGKGKTPEIVLNPAGQEGSSTTLSPTNSIDQFSLSPAGAGGDWFASGYGSNTGIFDYGANFDSSLSPFIGSPSTNVYIPVYTQLSSLFGVSGEAVSAEISGYGEAELIVNYNYTPVVPEPGTMLLMGGALTGLGIIGRRARQRRHRGGTHNHQRD